MSDQIADAWDDTPAEGGVTEREQSKVPDGEYLARCMDLSVFAATSGEYYASWWFEVVDGPYRGSTLQRFLDLPGGAGYMKTDLMRVLNGPAPTWAELYNPDTNACLLKGLALGALCKVRQRTNTKGARTFVDLYITALVAPGPARKRQLDKAEGVDNDSAADRVSAAVAVLDSQPEPAQRPTPPLPKAPEPVAGWGDPNCSECKGAGCDNCDDIPF